MRPRNAIRIRCSTIVECGGAARVFRRDADWFGRGSWRRADRHDRCNLSQNPTYGVLFGRENGGGGLPIGRTKRGMHTKLHAICDRRERLLSLCMIAGRASNGSEKRCKIKGCVPASPTESNERRMSNAASVIKEAQSDRNYVRETEGLAACGIPLRLMPKSLPVGNYCQSSRHLRAYEL